MINNNSALWLVGRGCVCTLPHCTARLLGQQCYYVTRLQSCQHLAKTHWRDRMSSILCLLSIHLSPRTLFIRRVSAISYDTHLRSRQTASYNCLWLTCMTMRSISSSVKSCHLEQTSDCTSLRWLLSQVFGSSRSCDILLFMASNSGCFSFFWS